MQKIKYLIRWRKILRMRNKLEKEYLVDVVRLCSRRAGEEEADCGS